MGKSPEFWEIHFQMLEKGILDYFVNILATTSPDSDIQQVT